MNGMSIVAITHLLLFLFVSLSQREVADGSDREARSRPGQARGGRPVGLRVPDTIYAKVIDYDKDKLPNGPKAIADFSDTKKFPGKRGCKLGPWKISNGL